jgi:hypothetical protein
VPRHPHSELRRFTSGGRSRGDAVRVAELAARQGGVVGWGQLEGLGVGEATICRWVDAGRLHPVHHGVYAVGHSHLDLTGRLHAALLYAGSAAVLSHTTAASHWGLIADQPRRVHLTVPGRCRSLSTVRAHHTRRIERTEHLGLPVTPVARTLLDLASLLPFAQLRRALAEADFQGLLRPRAVEAVLGRGRPGSAALRRSLARHLPELAATRSVLEEGFLALCERSAIRVPEVNATVEHLMVDALWAAEKVIVELDGQSAHASAANVEQDRAREHTLRRAGYLVIRYSWQQVTRRPEAVAAELRAELAGRD